MLTFNIYEGKDENKEERWRWKLLDDNNNIARSEEPFLQTSIIRSIKTLIREIDSNTPVYEDESKEDIDEGYRFEYFKGEDDKFYWRIKAGNNELMAIGGQGFETKEKMLKDINNIKNNIENANIDFEKAEDDPSYDAKESDTTENNPSIPSGSL